MRTLDTPPTIREANSIFKYVGRQLPPWVLGSARNSGFTLVEILFVVGIISLLGGVAMVAIIGTREETRSAKLASDVATINAAIQVYQANGGSLAGSLTEEEVLAKLKTQADESSAAKIIGLRGNMVDLRLGIERQSQSEGQSSKDRAVWNPTSTRFEIRTSGNSGVKNFVLLDEEPIEPSTEVRSRTINAGGEGWVWDYQDGVAVARPGFGTSPGTAAVVLGTPLIPPNALQLNAPLFSQSGGDIPLINFDLSLTLSNPNPPGTSQIYYSTSGGSHTLYKGETITVPPGINVSAYAATSDPDHWYNSATASHTYDPVPVLLQLSLNLAKTALTYAEVGGEMTRTPKQSPAPASVTLQNGSQIPSKYLTSGKFQTYHAYQGADPLSGGVPGPNFTGNYLSPQIPVDLAHWGTASTLVVSAAAKSLDTSMFTDSPVATATIGIIPTNLASPLIDPPPGTKAADLPVSIALAAGQNYPVGSRIYYTLDGTDPGNSGGNPVKGFLYTGQFNSGAGTNGVVVVTSRVYGPAGYGQWFNPSPAAITAYATITFPDGALVGNASLNGTFVGSLMYATPANGSMNSINFNSGARILNGNLYLPGTPPIRLSNGTVWSPQNDGAFASYIQGWEFDDQSRKTVKTTPRVIDETGSALPNNYTVSFNQDAILEGKVIRRHVAPAFPVIQAPPPANNNNNVNLNVPTPTPISASQYANVTINSSNVGDVRLLPGNYKTLMANNNTAFVLGDPNNPEVTQFYSFENLNLNSASDLKIVGKVIITVKNQINLNSGSILGDPAHPEWLQLQFSSGNFTANSGSMMYGQLVVPTGSVTFNAGSIFMGSVTAQQLTINSSGVVFNLPPVIQN